MLHEIQIIDFQNHYYNFKKNYDYLLNTTLCNHFKLVTKLKEWVCVQVGHHKQIGEVIESHEKVGWSLHTYQAVGTPTMANHYLLFEREK